MTDSDSSSILRAALQEISDHAHDEDWWQSRAVCSNPFHTTHFSQRGERFSDEPGWCPDCFSSWWSTDGDLPGDGSYAIEATARKALHEAAE